VMAQGRGKLAVGVDWARLSRGGAPELWCLCQLEKAAMREVDRLPWTWVRPRKGEGSAGHDWMKEGVEKEIRDVVVVGGGEQ